MRKYNVFLKVNSSQINPFQVHISNLFLQPALLARPPQSSVFPCPSFLKNCDWYTSFTRSIFETVETISPSVYYCVHFVAFCAVLYKTKNIFFLTHVSKHSTFKSQVVSQDDFPWT